MAIRYALIRIILEMSKTPNSLSLSAHSSLSFDRIWGMLCRKEMRNRAQRKS